MNVTDKAHILNIPVAPEVHVELIPIFDNNYVFLIVNTKTQEALVVDPGESLATMRFLQKRKLKLAAILVTHHHHDHIDGISELKKEFKPIVYAPLKNKGQIPDVDVFVGEGAQFKAAECEFKVMELPGHTLGHIAYWCGRQNWLFSGDVLFGLGCGRLFEGSFEQMFQSLGRIKKLPSETKIFCTHEYTETNLQFCETLSESVVEDLHFKSELDIYSRRLRSIRIQSKPSVPLKLAEELKANPFLVASRLEIFKVIRNQRNNF